MITVNRLEVQSFSLEFLDVSWQIARTTETITDYEFVVQRSESPEGPFDSVSIPLIDIYSYRDEEPDLGSKNRIFYYRIQVRHTPTDEVSYSPVGFLGLQPDLTALAMAQQHQLLLKVHIGTPALVYKKRTFGPPCPNCFDPQTNRKRRSNCTLCFDSEYRGGYLAPIGTFVNFTPSTKGLQLSPFFEAEPNEITVDLSGYPPLSVGDLIVEPRNRRYRVQSVQERSKQGFMYRQIGRLKELPRTDVVYQFEINPAMFPTREGELWPKPADFGPIGFTPETPPGR